MSAARTAGGNLFKWARSIVNCHRSVSDNVFVKPGMPDSRMPWVIFQNVTPSGSFGDGVAGFEEPLAACPACPGVHIGGCHVLQRAAPRDRAGPADSQRPVRYSTAE